MAAEGAYVAGSSQAGGFQSEAQSNRLVASAAAEKRQSDVLSSIATTEPKGRTRDALASDANVSFVGARDRALKAAVGSSAKNPKITKDTATILNDLHGVEAGLFQKLLVDTRSHRSSAERAAKVFILAALLAVIGAAIAAVVLGRRITRPLQRLTAAADHLASEQMPAGGDAQEPSEEQMGRQMGTMKPIDIKSKDEIGRLATSFNEVQRVAGEVAVEQAALLRKGIGDMFVNLARRTASRVRYLGPAFGDVRDARRLS